MRISWDSHEKMKIVNDSHENLMSFSPNLMRISRDFRFHVKIGTFSHEIFLLSWASREISHEFLMRFSWVFFFTWKLERFLMRISWECHEILMSIFGRFLMKTLNMEIDACTEFSWDSHEIVTRLKFSHEILMRVQWSHELLTRFSWDSHEILMRLSRDSHDIITRFLWDYHEIQVYRYNEHKPIHPFFSSTFFFFVRLATFCEVTLAAKKINNIFCIYIYENLLKSDSHSLIQTFPLLVLATLLW